MEEEFHNHMRIPWHDYTRKSIGRPITEASLSEKASIIGRTGIMLLSCGTGAWRVRSSMNTLARELGITCTADIGLLSIEYTCIDGGNCYTESLCLFNTGVNTSKLSKIGQRWKETSFHTSVEKKKRANRSLFVYGDILKTV